MNLVELMVKLEKIINPSDFLLPKSHLLLFWNIVSYMMSLNRRGKESGAFVLISNLHDNENVNGPGIGDAKYRTIVVRIDLCARTKRSRVLFVQTLLPPLGILYALTKSRFGNDSSPSTSHVNHECNTNRLVVSHFTHNTSYVQKNLLFRFVNLF